jgi:uncharacterized repeat protein (TIGR03833 family)
MPDARIRDNIKPGTKVRIVERENQKSGKLTEGIVEKVLTNASRHPHGILVQLKEGMIGRVKEVIDGVSTAPTSISGTEKDLDSKKDKREFGFSKDLADNSVLSDKTTLEELIRNHENHFVEFKSSFRFDYKKFAATGVKDKSKDVEKSIAKTVAAFLNANGGIILIGISDEGKVLGIEEDLLMLNKHNTDTFRLQLKNSFASCLSNNIVFEHLKIGFQNVSEKMICILHLSPSPEPVFVKDGGREECYVRVDNESKQYQMSEFMEYWERRRRAKRRSR